MPNCIVIRGTVVNDDTSAALGAVDVHVVAHAGRDRVIVDSARTDLTGHFAVTLNEAVGLPTASYELVFRQGGRDRAVASDNATWRGAARPNDCTFRLTIPTACSDPDEPTMETTTEPYVNGWIRHVNGVPAGGLTVKLYKPGLAGGETQLGSATVGAGGTYVIGHTEPAGPDLYVRVWDASTLVETSTTVVNAGSTQRIDVLVCGDAYRGDSLYTKLDSALSTLLFGATLADVTPADMAYLAQKTSHRLRDVADYIIAQRLDANPLTDSLPSWSDAQAEVFFGLVNQGLPVSLPRLMMRPVEVLETALESAVSSNAVSLSIGTNAAGYAQDIKDLIAERSADASVVGSIGALLALVRYSGSTSLTSGEIEYFCQQVRDHTGDIASFWSGLSSGSFPAAAHTDTKRILSLGRVTLNYADYVDELNTSFSDPTLDQLVDQQKDAAGWQTHFTGTSLDLPHTVATAAEYGQIIYENLEALRPHRSVSKKVASIVAPGALQTYLNANLGFDWDGTNIYEDVADTDPQDELAKYQRAYRLCPKGSAVEGVNALHSAGLFTARAVAKKGLANLKTTLSGLSTAVVASIYDNSLRVNARTSAMYAMLSPTLQMPRISTVPSVSSPDDLSGSSPAYGNLFGSLDQCECEHCRSVFGPAAYYVDLLKWLDDRGAGTELETRRPDLWSVELNCDNALTAMPYVDLAIEAMENAIASPSGYTDETSATTEELVARPEQELSAAYNTLKDTTSTYPSILPFDLALEKTRAYLAHAGVPLVKLWETYAGASSPVTDARIAGEALRLCEGQQSVVQAGATSSVFDEFYDGKSAAQLQVVGTFIDVAGIEYEELLDLVHARFVNGSDALTIQAVATTDGCTLDDLQMGASEPAAVDYQRFNLFQRVWQSTGWSALDLDKALFALGAVGANVVTGGVLIKLGDLARLHESTQVPLAELCGWFATIDTRDDRDGLARPIPSVYAALFSDRSVFPADDATFNLSAPGSTSAELMTTVANGLPGEAARIQAAMGLSGDDFEAALQSLADDDLKLTNLSEIYRLASLARVAGCSVEQALTFTTLAGVNPFSSPAGARSWLDLLSELRASGLSIDQAAYLCAQEPGADGRIGPTESLFQEFLGGLRDDVRTVLDSIATVSSASYEEWVTAIERHTSNGPEALHEELDDPSPVAADIKADLDGLLPDLLVDSDALATACAAAASLEDRYALVVNAIYEGEAYESVREAIIEAIAELTGLDKTVAATLDQWASTQFTPTSITGVFLTDSFVDLGASVDPDDPWGDLSPATDAEAFTAAELAYMAGRLMLALKVDQDTADWWASQLAGSNVYGLLGFDELAGTATTNGTTIAANFAALRDSVVLLGLERRLPGSSPSWPELLETLATDHSGFIADLCDRTGWNATEVAALATGLGLGTTALLASATALVTFLDGVDILGTTGGDASRIVDNWITNEPSASASEVALQAARAPYSSLEAWSPVGREIRGPIRKRQQEALVAYLIGASAEFTEPADLYAELLIDVEMSPCMLTSRLKQAISSAQLFTHRCFLGLESGIELSEADRQEWEWRQSYRVWEAARKVFLYPENWIEPELREDTTPFFDELRDEVLQNDLTDEFAEDVMTRYLEKLQAVSRLRVVGTFHQTESDEDGEVDILHVIARGRSEPKQTWYRQMVDGREWTPWFEVPYDIKTDKVVLYVYARRLLVMWPSFLEAADTSNENGDEWYDITLNYGEYRDGRWAEARTSGESIRSTRRSTLKRYYLAAYEEDGRLHISVNWDKASTSDGSNNLQAAAHLGYFRLDNCTGEMVAESFLEEGLTVYMPFPKTDGSGIEWIEEDVTGDSVPSSDSLMTPRNAYAHDQSFGIRDTANKLIIKLGAVNEVGHVEDPDAVGEETLLGAKQDATVVTVSRQHNHFVGQSTFFVEDETRAWFVVPGSPDDQGATTADETDASAVGVSAVSGYRPWAPIGDTSAYVSDGRVFSGISESDLEQTHTRGESASEEIADTLVDTSEYTFRFYAFDHPYCCSFMSAVRRFGVMGLLKPEEDGANSDLLRQGLESVYFNADYSPSSLVQTSYPTDNITFELEDAYAAYNWEIFFHIPFFIAKQLSKNHRFEDAMRWFHTIFDPTNTDSGIAAPQRYWLVKPLMEADDAPVTDWSAFIGSTDSEEAQRFEALVEAWEEDPFDPHLIARFRPSAYSRAVFMAYVDNLIDWGDMLFRRDTLESINQATQLYMIAKGLLGDRPVLLPARETPTSQSYSEIETDIDAFGNVLTKLENYSYTFTSIRSPRRIGNRRTASRLRRTRIQQVPDVGSVPYFCVQPNDHLIQYWDTVDDRLYKIRNCMNIEGQIRTLALFEPAIDPGALVRATASGASLGTALSSLSYSRPHYRFRSLIQRAQAFAGSVRALGGALLSAMEKRDSEALAQLRAGHEVSVLEGVGDVRALQLEEAKANLASTKKSMKNVEGRRAYYQGLVDAGLLPAEIAQEANLVHAASFDFMSQQASTLGSFLALVPDATAGVCAGATWGGTNLRNLMSGVASALGSMGSVHRFAADSLGRAAMHQRRVMDWEFQVASAEREIETLEEQITAASKRLEIAKKEVKNHARQLKNAESVAAFMTTKYTNKALYSWMVTQISTIYFQSYQLANTLAKLAEQAYQYELGVSASFIQYGHYDSLRKGLLAGEKLSYDLDRMEAAYFENNAREFEITKEVSLAAVDGVALQLLKENGVCYFHVDEVLFDLDFPGHYFRRIKSVSVTIPAVDGTFNKVNGTLTMLGSSIRTDTDVSSGYVRDTDSGTQFYGYDARFSDSTESESIAVSRAQQDNGLFQADLRDERYLPFEGRGSISSWKLELPGAADNGLKQFDWDSISDVVLELRYTARDGGSSFRAAMVGELETAAKGLLALKTRWSDDDVSGMPEGGMVRVFSAKRDFPDAWHAFMHPDSSATSHVLVLPLGDDHFPKEHVEASINVQTLGQVWLPSAAGLTLTWPTLATDFIGVQLGSATEVDVDVTSSSPTPDIGGLPAGTTSSFTGAVATVTITVDAEAITQFASGWKDASNTSHLDAANFDDLFLVVQYQVT